MEFAETKKVSRRSPWELKFVRYILRLADLTKSVKWRAYVMSGGVPTRLHGQYLPQGKEKLLLRVILCLKRRSCFTSACTLLKLHRATPILRWNHQANELQLPPSLKPVKALSQMTTLVPEAFFYSLLANFATRTASYIFFYWHEALRAEKRKPVVATVGNLTFMPSAFDRRFWLEDIFTCSMSHIIGWIEYLWGWEWSVYVHLYGYVWRTFALSTDSLTSLTRQG